MGACEDAVLQLVEAVEGAHQGTPIIRHDADSLCVCEREREKGDGRREEGEVQRFGEL